jgi:hypothetical protein
MREILPGLWHWTTFHDGIGVRVSSYYVEPAGALVDPRVPEEGLAAFEGRARPQQVILTIGLHLRHSERFAEAFGCTVRASRAAQERIGDALPTTPYRDGEEVAPGITAIEVGALAPDEYALHIDVGDGAIAFADALTRYGGALGFVPDGLMGPHPDRVKAGLIDAFRGLLAREFDTLLFAHGEPLVDGGKEALRAFVESPVGHQDFGQSL